MPPPQSLERLTGDWTGTSRLWRPWLTPPDTQSGSTATVAPAVGGKFLTIGYTWIVDGEAQEGLLLLGQRPKEGAVSAIWVDSWHMSDVPMVCSGTVDGAGVVNVLGSYAAPPGPDWRWRTVIDPARDGSFEIVMYNISPDGEETLAFRNRYQRDR